MINIRPIALAVLFLGLISAPFAVLAQNTPYSQLIINTQLAPGVSAPAVAPIVMVTATSPTINGVFNSNTPTISYASSFQNDTRTVTFVPGSYDVSATASGYYFTYSQDCTGFTPTNGVTRYCAIVLSNTPPPSPVNCPNGQYANGSCLPGVIPYQGPAGPSQLSCSPTSQTVALNQPATFIASGGTPGGYTWTTPNNTSLNVGPNFTTLFQSLGVQTVTVHNGVQSASCMVNVVASSAAPGITVTYQTPPASGAAGVPSVASSYMPSSLPNTGFGPQDGAMFAFALVFLLAGSIYIAPYVRQALAVALG